LVSAAPTIEARLVFGVTTEADLFCVDEVSALSQALPNLDIVTTVERPTAGWSGAVGQVTDHLDPIGPTTTYYVCGPPGMIGACEEVLVGRGVPRDRIQAERFLETGDQRP
jgi:methane monooxygenase component C